MLQTVGKLSSLAKDKLYAEQKWVTGYLKSARNKVDKESAVLQKFLRLQPICWQLDLTKQVQHSHSETLT